MDTRLGRECDSASTICVNTSH